MKIFLWKLGNLEHKLYPSEKSIDELKQIINDWDGECDLHVVSGPDIELEIINISSEDMHDIKYKK